MDELLLIIGQVMSWLVPLIMLAGAAVCWAHRERSAHMALLVMAFLGHFVAAVVARLPVYLPALRDYRDLLTVVVVFVSLASWVVLVAGLAAVLRDLGRRIEDLRSTRRFKVTAPERRAIGEDGGSWNLQEEGGP